MNTVASITLQVGGTGLREAGHDGPSEHDGPSVESMAAAAASAEAP